MVHKCVQKISYVYSVHIFEIWCTLFFLGTHWYTNVYHLATLSPLYKGKGNIDECDNYRAISILQPMIKVFERILAAKVVSYFVRNNLFCSAQHGFRSNHSCETALQCIIDDWKALLSIVFLLFIDFKKAFDLINREILFLKLFHYVFDNNSLNLFKDYFENRNQKTRIGSDISIPLYLDIGVPQGSVLGHLLFLIYSRLAI